MFWSHKRFGSQKDLGSLKNFQFREILGSNNISGLEKFWVQKHLWSQKMLGPENIWFLENLGFRKILVLKKFGVPKNLVSRKILDPEIFQILKKNLVQRNFGSTNVGFQKILGVCIGQFVQKCSVHNQDTFQILYTVLVVKINQAVGGQVGGWVVSTMIIEPFRGPTCKLEPARSKQGWIPSWARVWQKYINTSCLIVVKLFFQLKMQ